MSLVAPVADPPSLIAAVGPRVRTSPFFEATVEDGLESVSTYNHMWLPMGYGDPAAEYERLTTAVSMWDVAAQRHIELRGHDATRLLQIATIVDVEPVEPGGGIYAPMLDHEGVLINDPIVVRLDDCWRVSIADADIRLWLAAVAAERHLDVIVTELETATLAVQGPRSWAVAAGLGLPDLSGFEAFTHRAASVGDIPVRISHSGWSGQGGFELFLDDADRALVLWARVREAGRPHGIGPGAPNPAERIENVLRSYGTDTGYDAHPDEVGLGHLVDLDDGGDFIGRAAVVEARRRGIARQQLGVVLDGDRIGTLPRPVPILDDTETCGELRAASWSPRWEANLGLALVDRDVTIGQTGEVVVPEGRRRGRFVELPFDLPRRSVVP
jgi:glycine cleavage system aminomethyltransferase T